MDTLFDALVGIGMNAGSYNERLVANDTIGDITLDTAYTYDAGYETAIWRGDNDMIICERYESKEDAVKGHIAWVDKVQGWIDNDEIPETVWSVQFESEEKL